jgi:hypothetical protein
VNRNFKEVIMYLNLLCRIGTLTVIIFHALSLGVCLSVSVCRLWCTVLLKEIFGILFSPASYYYILRSEINGLKAFYFIQSLAKRPSFLLLYIKIVPG